MKKVLFILSCFYSLAVTAQGIQKLTVDSFLPKGYVLLEKIYGDLNKDSINDCVLLIKGTDKTKIISGTDSKPIDRNRRGIIILFKKNNGYEIDTKNYKCFSSENEDGGIYFAPELSIEIKKGNLNILYGHGRYGFWSYTIRYQNNNFDLIGYDNNECLSGVTKSIVSINFSTKIKIEKVNINSAVEGEKPKVIKEKIKINKLLTLSVIKDFDELDMSIY